MAWTTAAWRQSSAQRVAAPSFADLMSEQMAEKLQQNDSSSVRSTDVTPSGEEAEYDADLAYAIALSKALNGDAEAADAAADTMQPPVPPSNASTAPGAESGASSLTAHVEEPAGAGEGRPGAPGAEADGPELDADMALAMAMQEEERREYERIWRYQRENAGSKVQLTFNGKLAEEWTSEWGQGRRFSADDAGRVGLEDLDDDDDDMDAAARTLQGITPAGGRRRKRGDLMRTRDGEVITKHDPGINGVLNAMDLSAHYDGAGDLDGASIPNTVFNALKHDLKKGESFKGMAARGKIEESTRATQEGVLDARTRLILFKMIGKGTLFREVGGVVKTGKESNVYFAPAPADAPDGPGCAVKIFKTTLSEFGNRFMYIDQDPRYKEFKFNRQTNRKMFTIWAEKEMRNLIRVYRAGIPCPEPLEQKEHVLVMSFLGTDGWPAPQLREVKMSEKQWRSCYRQVLGLIRAMYHRAALVHADLSEYNLLMCNGQPHVIDVGQSVHIRHPRASKFLRADIKHVREYFTKMGVETAPDDEVFSYVRMRRDPAEWEVASDDEVSAADNGEGTRGVHVEHVEAEEDDGKPVIQPINEEEEAAAEEVLEKILSGVPFEVAVCESGFLGAVERVGDEEGATDGAMPDYVRSEGKGAVSSEGDDAGHGEVVEEEEEQKEEGTASAEGQKVVDEGHSGSA